MNDNKKQIIKMSAIVLGLFAVILSATYAFINIQLEGTKKQVITVGTLDLELDEDENNLTITDALPMYDDVGMIQEPFTFRLINNVSTPTNYILKLVDITTGDKLPTNVVKYGLTKNGVGEPKLLSTLPETGEIDAGVIGDKETIEYTLRLWIDSSVTDNSQISGKSLSYRVDVEVSQEIETIRFSLNTIKELAQESTADFPNFKYGATATNNNGQGIYKYQEDGEDIYYWRGVVNDNNVIFGGYCWQMVRTTKTGGIKMIYNGEVVEPVLDEKNNVIDGKCTNTGTATQLPTETSFNSSYKSLAYLGYMYGNTVYQFRSKPSNDAVLATEGILYGYDVDVTQDAETGTYTYELKTKEGGSLFSSTGSWEADSASVGNGNHYTCFNTTGNCETVSYVFYTGDSSTPYYIELTGGTTIEQALEQMYSNDQPSDIKTYIEKWFAGSNLAKQENLEKIEDTVYCNDRSVQDMTTNGWSKDGVATASYIMYSARTRRDKGTPDLSCRETIGNRDRFTYEDTTNGNGLLNWPVGLLTASEIILAGGQGGNKDYYLYTSQSYWLLSPANANYFNVYGNYVTNGYLSETHITDKNGVRPVISLRTGTSFLDNGADGTKEKPYVVE